MKRLNSQQKTTKKSRWPKVCLILSVALIVFAGILYITQATMLNREFGWSKEYFGSSYDELYRLSTPDKEMKNEVIAQAEAAFEFIGSEEELKGEWGALEGYCAALEREPEAARVDYTLDLIAGKTDGSKGYLWVAYTYRLYNEEGGIITSSGTEDQRILSRWTVEKTENGWVVTAIKEHP